jgi:hypothetical protein
MFQQQFPKYGSKCVHSGNVVGENTKIKDVKQAVVWRKQYWLNLIPPMLWKRNHERSAANTLPSANSW